MNECSMHCLAFEMGHWVSFVTLKHFVTSELAKKIRKTHLWFVNLAVVWARISWFGIFSCTA